MAGPAQPGPPDRPLRLARRPTLLRPPSEFYVGTSLAQRGVNGKLQYLLDLMKLFNTAGHLKNREINPEGLCFAYEATGLTERLLATLADASSTSPAELPTATHVKKSTIARMRKVEMDLVSVLTQDNIRKIQTRDPQFLQQIHDLSRDPILSRYRALLRELTHLTPLQLQHLIIKRRQVEHLIEKTTSYMKSQGDGVAAAVSKLSDTDLFCLYNLIGIYSAEGLRKMLSAEIVPSNCACALSTARHIVSFRPLAQGGWEYSDSNFNKKVVCLTFEEIHAQFAKTLRSLNVSLPSCLEIEVIGKGPEPSPATAKPTLYYVELFKALQAGLGNASGQSESPLLCRAVSRGQLILVRQLLAYRARDTFENFMGIQPRVAPLGKRQINVNILFDIKSNKMNPLILAILLDRTEIACELIEHPEIDVNLKLLFADDDPQSREYFCALYAAINKENFRVVIALLQHPRLEPPDIPILSALAKLALTANVEPLFSLALEKITQAIPKAGPIDSVLHDTLLRLCLALMSEKQYLTLATVLSQCPNACASSRADCLDDEIATAMVRALREGTPLDTSSYSNQPFVRAPAEDPIIEFSHEEKLEIAAEIRKEEMRVRKEDSARGAAFADEYASVFRPYFENACRLIQKGDVAGLQALLAPKPFEIARFCELPLPATAEAKDATPTKPRPTVEFSSILQEIVLHAPVQRKLAMIEMIQKITPRHVFSDMLNAVIPGHGTILHVLFAERSKAEKSTPPDLATAGEYHRILHNVLNDRTLNIDINRQNPQNGNTLLHAILSEAPPHKGMLSDLGALVTLHKEKKIDVDLELANFKGETIATLAQRSSFGSQLLRDFAPVKLGPRPPLGPPPPKPAAPSS